MPHKKRNTNLTPKALIRNVKFPQGFQDEKKRKHIVHQTAKHLKHAISFFSHLQDFLTLLKLSQISPSSLSYKNVFSSSNFTLILLHSSPTSHTYCQASLTLYNSFSVTFFFLKWKNSAVFYYYSFHLHLSPQNSSFLKGIGKVNYK